MRRVVGSGIGLTLLLAACHVEAPLHTDTRTTRPSASASHPGASAMPSGLAGSPGPTPAATATLQHLQAPKGDTTQLAGSVAVDAGYIVAQGGGNIVAQGGGNVVAVGNAGIVAQGGGNVVSTNSGNIVAQGGGNIVAQGGGNIVAQGGGNLIASTTGGAALVADDNASIVAQGGGNIVAQGGGNIVAQGGGNIVAQGGGNFRLAAADVPAAGTVLPAAGMLVSVIDLATHQYLSLGQDPNGHNVYAVYTDARGGYHVYVPKATAGNVMVVASVPGSRQARLAYNLIPAVSGDHQVLDEDAALVTRFLRAAMASRLASYMLQNDPPATAACPSRPPVDTGESAFNTVAGDFVARMKAASRDAKLASRSQEERERVAAYMGDVMLASMGPDVITGTLVDTQFSKFYAPPPGTPPEPALDYLSRRFLHVLTQDAEAKLAADPHAFDADVDRAIALVKQNNQNQAKLPCSFVYNDIPQDTRILKATDVGFFLEHDLLAEGDGFRFRLAVGLLETAGMATAPPNGLAIGLDNAWDTLFAQSNPPERPAVGIVHHMLAAVNGFVFQIATRLLDPDTQNRLLQQLQTAAGSPAP